MKRKPNIHKYATDVSRLSRKCILCGTNITDTDFEYEDYFIVFRGFTPDAAEGFAHFECIKEKSVNGTIRG